MAKRTATMAFLDLLVPSGTGGSVTPPNEFLLFKFGTNDSEKGSFTFDKESASSCLAAAQRKGNDLPIDYEHNMVLPNEETPGDGPQPAAGWFSLSVKDDGLYAVNVKWTDRAKTYLTNKEYRYFSPAFLHKEGHIEEIINCALTNTPAQHNQLPLIAAKDDEHTKEPQMLKTLLATLKLSDSSQEADAVTAILKLQRQVSEYHKVSAFSGKDKPSEALGVFRAWKESAERTDEAEKELFAIRKERKASRVEQLVAKGIADRKIKPADKEKSIKLGMQNGGLAMLKSYLEVASPIVGKKRLTEVKDGQVQVVLTPDMKRIAMQIGAKPEDIIKRMAMGQGLEDGERHLEDEAPGKRESA